MKTKEIVKQAKYTPGKWESNDGEVVREVKPGLFTAVPIYTNRIAGTLTPISDDWYEAKANARLIASAPELLQKLKMSEEIISGIEAEADNKGIDLSEARAWWLKAQAIIAKAEGSI